MTTKIPSDYVFSPEVAEARRSNQPIVALETAVVTHGLPYPMNLELARDLESAVRAQGAFPATIGLLNGKIHVGLTADELEQLGTPGGPSRKVSRRDFGLVLARKEKGGTTVAATLIAAHAVGLKVFATGGIGGVHRGEIFDVSADLPELGRTPLVVVCAGAKSILDLPATLEVLETQGVTVLGYQTDEFPGFYSRESGLPVGARVDTPAEVAEIARRHWALGIEAALLVTAPPPAEVAVPREQIEGIIQQAQAEAVQQGIHGAKVTPFLLSRVSELSGGSSLRANLALLRNNAAIAGQIACAMVVGPKTEHA